ncbi:MAG: WYL domain-containing protein [Bacilli bacterium]|nr:WYL domain-containing protein [Bacilli bacterium]
MSKVSNAILLLELLSTGKKYSIQELSNILEVTPRMVRAYKDDLEKAGIYIDTIRGPYGGYVLNQSIRIPSRKFKKSDYEFLNSLSVPKEKKVKLNELSDKIRGIYFGSKEEIHELDSTTKPIYNTIVKAMKNHNKLKINYYSYNKGNNNRIVHPLDLFLTSNGWGLAAYCELKKDLRHFELKRISQIEILEEKF